MVDKHIVANYLGDWSYDIIINRGVTNKDGDRIDKFKDENEYPLYFPLFMHTYGGYVFIYGANHKDENTQKAFQKTFREDLKKKFLGYPIVNVRSDAEPGFTNKLKILGENTTLQKKVDVKHILMAKINSFASLLRAAIYQANGEYNRTNPPMSIYNIREFTDKWNHRKVRGMDCTREELLQDKNLELSYTYMVVCTGISKQKKKLNKFLLDQATLLEPKLLTITV